MREQVRKHYFPIHAEIAALSEGIKDCDALLATSWPTAYAARIIGNTISRNGRNGLTVQQASHADVAGNLIDGNAQQGIRVAGNSGVNLADSAMLLFNNAPPVIDLLPDLNGFEIVRGTWAMPPSRRPGTTEAARSPAPDSRRRRR